MLFPFSCRDSVANRFDRCSFLQPDMDDDAMLDDMDMDGFGDEF